MIFLTLGFQGCKSFPIDVSITSYDELFFYDIDLEFEDFIDYVSDKSSLLEIHLMTSEDDLLFNYDLSKDSKVEINVSSEGLLTLV